MLRCAREGEAVAALERRPLRALEELVVAADLEPRGVRGELADALDAELARVRGAHAERVGVLEAERRGDLDRVLAAQELRDLGEHARAVLGKLRAVHQRRVDRARVLDVDVDLVRAQRVEGDGRAERGERARRQAGRLRDPRGEQLGEHVLLGEGLGADHDLARGEARRGRREAQRGPRAQPREQPERAGDERAAPLAQARLERADQLVEQQRERGGGRAADADRDVVACLEAAEDEVPEARRADRRRERRGADDPDRRRAQPRDDHGHRERQL